MFRDIDSQCGLKGPFDAAAAADMREWRHGGGWSVDASVRVADWDRQAPERPVRNCARPPLASGRLGRLGRLGADTLGGRDNCGSPSHIPGMTGTIDLWAQIRYGPGSS